LETSEQERSPHKKVRGGAKHSEDVGGLGTSKVS